MNRRHFTQLLSTSIVGSIASCSKQSTINASGKPIIRFGHFPNITHVQALVAHQFLRQGKGWFEERLGAQIDWHLYNAGPSATEAIFAKSKVKEMRVLAGAANGGSALIALLPAL